MKITILGKKFSFQRDCPPTDGWECFYSGDLTLCRNHKPDTRDTWIYKLSLSGPWYDDSDPEGRGQTVEEAVQSFELCLKKWSDALELNDGTV